jgi:hypothetical protein
VIEYPIKVKEILRINKRFGKFLKGP